VIAAARLSALIAQSALRADSCPQRRRGSPRQRSCGKGNPGCQLQAWFRGIHSGRVTAAIRNPGRRTRLLGLRPVRLPVGGQLVTDRIDWLRREKKLPRRLRCSGLAALRSAFGLPSGWPVVLHSRAGEGG
jgi:hypothetical protein